jgi:SAM-dependent methyltransferase
MPEYCIPPITSESYKQSVIYSFLESGEGNIDHQTVRSFGEEWSKFNEFDDEDIRQIGHDYFDLLRLPDLSDKDVLDVGCGTGRWANFLSPYVRSIEAIDPSDAVFVAVDLLGKCKNVRVTRASVDRMPFQTSSFDLVYSLGVLHHLPDTKLAISKCTEMLKPGGQLLLYLYYNLDNRGMGYRLLFGFTNMWRLIISRMPGTVKRPVSDLIAATVYWPMVQLGRLVNVFSPRLAEQIPLSYYRKTSFSIMRNDALDRFGTPLEKRFSRNEIESMLLGAGLTGIRFSEQRPYWHVIAQKP